MNNRDYKQFVAGEFYHVYNRGNGKQNIFLDEADYKLFLFRLRENLFPNSQDKTNEEFLAGRNQRKLLPANSFSLACYCLMPNHFHLLIRQNSEVPLSKLVSKISTSYSKSFNKRYNHIGHLFQDQFKAVWIDDEAYLMWLVDYIHKNPQKAGLVTEAKLWTWSSCRDFAGLRNGTLCDRSLMKIFFGGLLQNGVIETEAATSRISQDLLLDESV